MYLKRTLLLVAAVAAVMICYCATQAQDKNDKQVGNAVTATGCLSKGDEPGEFYLSADNGKRYELRSDTGLSLIMWVGTARKESEVEERVERKHKESAENEAANLQVTDVQMVSTNCK